MQFFWIKAQNAGINEDGSDPNANAILDVKSSTKGLFMPRMTTVQRTSFASVMGTTEAGMMVFDSDLNNYQYWTGTTWKAVGDKIISFLHYKKNPSDKAQGI